jgi:X-Pro dipeptidyl-peptidase (S15 family)
MRLPKKRTALLLVVVLLALGAWTAVPYVRAASLVIRLAGLHGPWLDRLGRFENGPVTTRDLTIPGRRGAMRARVYEPATRRARTVLLTGGVHAKGIDEPRLTKLARDLAVAGTPVVTAEIDDLLHYRITPKLTDGLEDAIVWVSREPSLAGDGRIGVFGVSFAGGLSIVAAGRPAVAPHVAYVISFGGHSSLPDVVTFLCTGRQPDGTHRDPHDYGVVVTLMNSAEQMVPADQVAGLRTAITSFMSASHLAMVDQKAAAAEFTRTKAMTAMLPEPSRTLMTYVNTRNVKALGAALLPHVTAFTQDPALSPARATTVTAPVFLLHGADDSVVPAIESRRLAAALGPRVPVHLLVSSLITHAEVDHPPTAGEVWEMVRFWRAVGAAGALSPVPAPAPAASARPRREFEGRHGASAAHPGPPSPAASAW